MKKVLKIMLVMAMFFTIPPVSAKEINHFTTKVDTDVTLKDNYTSSVVASGDEVTFDSSVKGIAIGAANQLKHKGTSDYAILGGNIIEIDGKINNDAFIAGNIITFEDEAIIGRDIIIVGSDIEISGTFNRNVSIYGSSVTFKNAVVSGNVKTYATKIKAQKNTKIMGTLSYPEDSSYKAEDGAVITKIKKTEPIQTADNEDFFTTLSAKVWSYLCLVVVFAVISLLFPGIFTKINNKFEKADLGLMTETFTKGLLTLVLVPILFVLLFITAIGIPLGFILVILYGIAMNLTTVFTGYLLGYKIWQKVFNKDAHLLLIGLFGLFILFICAIIPGIRILASILTTLIGLGIIIDLVKPNKE